MKHFTILLLTIFLTSATWSCITKKEVTKTTEKKDSINIENSYKQIDTVYKEKLVHLFEPLYTEVEIPCDSTKFNQSFKSGKSSYKITKEKGHVKIVFKRDSSSIKCESEYKVLYRENNALKTQISSLNKTFNKEVTKRQ